ncbi:NAD-dependent epimerase/dehydratase family protein [Anaerobacillus alkaliphilus]|uniref:NAD-dependent epimerase/dehydratase family protein n=1 Tax=Anaerobacillus alkaliphilus TaxID=1548597 RepID=A0A4Q0VVA1_9BACI|nr:NAD-dependent epimerase/dehydratase family protein [Anaerobacillus alkaliphilus]RXJ02256.1 NAD-dependent epimerase/dehydratase family protein [Anaerobacillus alkaliphilus]
MKKILVTGANSYVGTSFIKWLSQYPDKYSFDSISLRDDRWKESSFKGYDVVLHTVGIAHVDSNPDPKMEQQYYKVNRDLTIETAQKAKDEGVKQFIFLSSIIVYGDSSQINKPRIIDVKTVPKPANFYGNSKLLAEEGIKQLASDKFKVAIIRPPMIYGKESKGNYPKLAKVARKLPIFPNIENQRSMIYIDNLCEFIRLLVDSKDSGLFFPQNAEYVKTSELVKMIAEAHGNKIRLTKFFNPIIYAMGRRIGMVNKVFGSLVYDQGLSNYKDNYTIRNFNDSIRETEL